MASAMGNGKREMTLDSQAFGGSGPFKAYLLAGPNNPATSIILLHGRNSNPDNGPVIGMLRRNLHNLGYTTLSIANPTPQPDEFPNYVADVQGVNKLFPESYARVRAGMSVLAKLGTADAVLLGFSMGARMHAGFLAAGTSGALPVRGLIALSAGINGAGPLNIANSLPKVPVPVLDVYGEGDPMCADSAEARKTAYQSGAGKSFTQIKIGNKAAHGFDGNEAAMETAVREWLKQVAPIAI